ncbi:hypothetical protein [Paenibacillus daejeonensis]|uniref:hypothetical protein n=1 Tax=Paenibacillus daejeonensis TaxID=135193 RepID=UPI000477F662|nr:hypothetical protein [Paenibacillus daejeonensis]
MKKTALIPLTLAALLVAACGNDNATNPVDAENTSVNTPTPDNSTENASPADNETNESTGSGGNYSEVEAIPIDGHLSSTVFTMSADGNTLVWGEQDKRFDNASRIKLWMDGAHEELDLPDNNLDYMSISNNGKLVRGKADWDLPVEERHAILEYDPATGETVEYVMNNDWDKVITPARSNYMEEPHMYYSTLENSDEQLVVFYWDLATDEVRDIDLTELVRTETEEELLSYPRLAITKDQTELIGLAFDVGIFRYNLETEEAEFVYTTDNIFANNEKSQTRVLTPDDRYVLYATFDEEDQMTQHAFDLETGESAEIGMGITTYPLQDGRVMLVDYDEVFHRYDPATGELDTVHTPELTDDDRISGFTVSADGSTIAYVIRGEGNESTLHIMKQ